MKDLFGKQVTDEKYNEFFEGFEKFIQKDINYKKLQLDRVTKFIENIPESELDNWMNKFLKWEEEYERYCYDKLHVQTSSKIFNAFIDYIEVNGKSVKNTKNERFFAGGAYTIRGYEERKIGPIDAVTKDPLGGESMIVGNIEYTYPLFEFLKAAAFFDTGNVWRRMEDVGTGNFKSSFGFGARIKTPIGPVRLDYGIPLNKEPGEESKSPGRFHFSISHGF